MTIKRDGKDIGARPPNGGERMETVPIARLLPLEGAVVSATLQKYRIAITQGADFDKPKVIEVGDGNYLVRDGNHRIYAAKHEGRVEVAVRIVDPGMQGPYFLNEAKHAKRRGRLNFEGIVEVESDDERELFTKAEASDNSDFEFFDGLRE